jgi:hypothetical protein
MNVRINRGQFLSLGAAFLMALGAQSSAALAQSPAGASDAPDGLMKKLMEAVKENAYDDFMIECDDTMRAALTKQQFEGVSAMMAPSLQGSYKTTYLGKIRRKGLYTHLWKLDPGGGKDETLINISIKDKKVAGFFLQ